MFDESKWKDNCSMLYKKFMHMYSISDLSFFTDNNVDFNINFNNNSVIWNWEDLTLNVYKSVLPLQEQNNNTDKIKDSVLPILNSRTSKG